MIINKGSDNGGAGDDLEDNDGGAGGSSSDDSSGQGGGKGKGDGEGTVSRRDHERAIADLHKHKKAHGELSQKLNDLTKQFTDLKEKGLKDKQDFKGLYETESEKARRLESELSAEKTRSLEREKTIQRTARFNAVKIAALGLGLRTEATDDLDMLDMDDDVTVEETSTGRIFVSGAKEFAEKLRTTKPHWFSQPKVTKVNSGGGGAPGKGKSVTALDCWQADKDLKAGKITRDARDEIYKKFDEGKQAKA